VLDGHAQSSKACEGATLPWGSNPTSTAIDLRERRSCLLPRHVLIWQWSHLLVSVVSRQRPFRAVARTYSAWSQTRCTRMNEDCARPGIVRRRGNLRRSGLHLHPNDHNSDRMGAAAGMDRAVGALMSRTVLRSPSGRGPIGADWLRPAGGGDQSWASSHRMRRGPRVDNGWPARCSIRPQHRQAIDDHRHPPCPTTRSVPRLRMPQAPTRGTQTALTAKRRSAPRGTVAR
jgi:hypothetical protein